jgi:hypothetical protein
MRSERLPRSMDNEEIMLERTTRSEKLDLRLTPQR